jgi:hypothetical protein
VRGSYELTPGVKPFVEIRANIRVHDLNTDSSGYQRYYKGIAGLVGTSFNLRGTFTGDIAIGSRSGPMKIPGWRCSQD